MIWSFNMDSERIKEIQSETAYPASISVQQALLQVWDECEQESKISNMTIDHKLCFLKSMKAMKNAYVLNAEEKSKSKCDMQSMLTSLLDGVTQL